MPAGGSTLGIVYFASVKLAGYTAAAAYLRRALPENRPVLVLVGASRTLIGLAAGFASVFLASFIQVHRAEWLFFVLLFPVRIGEWLLLIRLFYPKPGWSWPRSLKLAALGAGWSYVLDVPALLAMFALPGGAWIC
jgi:ABC-type uncharacterized transport system permease subunit